MTEEQISKADDNVIFIGGKPFMNYIHGVDMQFKKGSNEVVIKARGKFISRAVDVAEYTKRESEGVEQQMIEINTEEFKNKEGKQVNVSTIEITLAKK